ncbi:YeiH family protein [Mangrovibacterium marinum]|uniref:Putative integral membrane protein (TIGR00698 family) n=1 Tax=Mangrovibacterium marinum TaxID=1639118 RepID=A0A2T5C1E9_9BACT|nr:putative sulfate exporter family transporter [Mangrovibacterium marinum]PTN08419.1 putative integral membrane protein (TIGR00698 family) [Mangrovibacterium marinum]
MKLTHNQIQLVYFVLLAACFLPFMSPALALLIGIGLSLLGIKHQKMSGLTALVLQASIVLMGFGMNLTQVVAASKSGFEITAISVVATISLGLLLGKLFKVDHKISVLIAAGTAICGGSAIAALAPVIKARNFQISFSLIVIFILNALALLVFPLLGHFFHLSQESFGYWAAIAIHDTSSVVGAGASYGAKALEIATTVKLTRALWIIPVSIVFAMADRNGDKGKIKIPWFIGLFVLAIVFAHFVPTMHDTFGHLNWLGKRGMVVALLLIGSNISIAESKQAGARSFILGIVLWFAIATLSFLAIRNHLIG